MEAIFEEKKLAIKDLSLWDENARFPDEYFNKSEIELINYFLQNDKFLKIKSLTEAIIKDFDLPQLEKLIVLRTEEKNIVLEGNRRLTVYKLLNNPKLTTKNDFIKYFEIKFDEIQLSENFQLECLVTEIPEQGLRYIDRKHIKGNNEVTWGDAERAYHNARRGNAKKKELFRIAISKLVRGLDIPKEMKESILGKGYVTTFFRILDSNPAWEEHGFKLDEKGNLTITNKSFEKDLKAYILNVLQKKDFSGNKVDSRSLNKNIEKSNYIQSVKKENEEKVNEEIQNNTSEDLFGNQSINIPNNNKETSQPEKSRSKTIPKGLFHSSDVPYKIGNTSLRLLYDELKNIDVSVFPNATHDLLRSFLECTLIVYFKKVREYTLIQKNSKHNPTLGEMLTHIINNKTQYITDVNVIEAVKQIKTDFDKPYSLERLNMMNHNENWVAKEREVRATWARLEELFKIMLNTQ
jgi:hypothetical protein